MNGIVSSMAPTRIRKGARPHVYIKEWMVHREVSDEDMAGRLGISRTTVWKRYTEQHRLDPGKIQQFADALGISRHSLNYPPTVESVDAILEDASPDDRKKAADMVRLMFGKAS